MKRYELIMHTDDGVDWVYTMEAASEQAIRDYIESHSGDFDYDIREV